MKGWRNCSVTVLSSGKIKIKRQTGFYWLASWFGRYFNFCKICDDKKVWLASNKLDNEVEEWWEDIQINRKWRGKHPICSWKKMKRILIYLWFPNDYYDILDYTNVDYKSIYSHEMQYVQHMKGQPQNQNYHS